MPTSAGRLSMGLLRRSGASLPICSGRRGPLVPPRHLRCDQRTWRSGPNVKFRSAWQIGGQCAILAAIKCVLMQHGMGFLGTHSSAAFWLMSQALICFGAGKQTVSTQMCCCGPTSRRRPWGSTGSGRTPLCARTRGGSMCVTSHAPRVSSILRVW